MSIIANQTRDADIDIAKLFAAIWRDKFKIIIISLLVTGLAFVVLSMVSPKYKSEARILVDSNESIFTRPSGTSDNQQPDQTFDEQGVASQVDILTSSELLISVAEDLDLGSREEFDDAMNVSAFKEVLVTIGLIADPRSLPKEKRVLNAVRERLSVYPRENSRVIVIEFETKDKDLAAAFPNALADAYLKLESQASLDTTGQAADYLANEIASLQASVRIAERKVADYRAANGLLQGQNNETLATQQLAELSTELSRIRSQRASAEARARTVQDALSSGQSIDALPDVISSPIVGRLREQEVNLRADLADLTTTLLDNHPEVKALRSQLSDLQGQLRVEAQKVLSSLRSEADIARDRETELERSLNQLKAASVTASEQEVELNALEREASTQRALLESYLIRYREAQARQETDYAPAKARLISSATTPREPVFPKMIPMLAVAFIGTALLMSMITLLGELFSGRAMVAGNSAASRLDEEVNTEIAQAIQEEATVASSVAPVASPILRSNSIGNDNAQAADGTISASELAQELIDDGQSRAVIVSPEGDAAALASVTLARAATQLGYRALLVDLSGSGASSFDMVGDDLPGITDLLAGDASYSNIIHPDNGSDAHCVPLGLANPEKAGRAIARLPIVLNALREAYDLVIVECGATNAEGLARMIKPGSEVIIAATNTRAKVVSEAVADLIEGGFDAMHLLNAHPDTYTPPPRQRAKAS